MKYIFITLLFLFPTISFGAFINEAGDISYAPQQHFYIYPFGVDTIHTREFSSDFFYAQLIPTNMFELETFYTQDFHNSTVYLTEIDACSGLTQNQCIPLALDSTYFPVPPPPPPPTSGFITMISDANTGYEAIIGENISASVGYAGGTFVKPILGGGLATLYALRYWIVALIMISIMAYFAYRAIGRAPEASYNKRI